MPTTRIQLHGGGTLRPACRLLAALSLRALGAPAEAATIDVTTTADELNADEAVIHGGRSSFVRNVGTGAGIVGTVYLVGGPVKLESVLTEDILGRPRAVDGGSNVARCDIGAMEIQGDGGGPPDISIPTLAPWGVAALAGLLGLMGMAKLRSRRAAR